MPADPRRRALLVMPLCGLAGRAHAAAPSAYALGLQFVDDRGAMRALAEWRGRPLVIAMAYGACRSICSSTLRTLEEVQARADGRGEALDFIVVGIDPAEDRPEDWAAYRKLRHLTRGNWTFLSGSPEATRSLARFLGVRFWRYDEHVMHDFKLLRLDADGAVAATLDWHHREAERLL
jgi:cytochrome oxidase Cu insertion factor (SCO1/SenC/PrrC family)